MKVQKGISLIARGNPNGSQSGFRLFKNILKKQMITNKNF
jgi:hypothetical protein